MSNKIKIGIPVTDPESAVKCEWVWAQRITDDMAKVCNIPVYTREFSLGALVRFDAEMKVCEVVERGARTLELIYDDSGSRDEVNERYRTIVTHLRQFDVHCEGMVKGLMALAVPADLDHDKLSEIIDRLGIACDLEPEPEPTPEEWRERMDELADDWGQE